MICKIRKEQDMNRVFLIIGAPIGPKHEFKFFKKQEFPHLEEEDEDFIDI